VNPGFWKKSTLQTDEIFECPNIEACKGGEFSDCTHGYGDYLCHSCGPEHHRTLPNICEDCDSTITALLVVAMLGLLVVFIGFLIR
jgi:hypothetical protein